MAKDLSSALATIPSGLRDPLIELYGQALSEYRAARWEALGVKAGKICEVIYSITSGKVSGAYPAHPSKPPNMVDACKKLEAENKKHGRSLCIQIPRVLTAVYELRNNRDIGHVGSDVDPNHMDAELLMRAVQWLMAELVRVFGNLTSDEAKSLVENLTERRIHAVWREADVVRVLNPDLCAGDKVLVVLYALGAPSNLKDLQEWVEYKNTTDFRRKVLRKLHDAALVHLSGDIVTLLPPGMRAVESRQLLAITF